MSMRQFQQELQKGLLRPVYLLHSPEEFLLYEALSCIRQRSGPAEAFNFDIIDAESPDPSLPMEHVVDLMNTLPLMSPRRTVIIRNFQSLAKKEIGKLTTYLASPSDTTLLVLLYSGRPPKSQDLTGHPKVKAIPLVMRDQEIPGWIAEKGRRLGRTFTEKAVDFLIASVGTDLGMLNGEIEKFASWDRPEIDIDDVRAVVYPGIEYSGFDLVNALMRGNEQEVFRIYEHLSRTMEAQMMLGALNWQFKTLWATQASGKETAEGKFPKIFALLHEADVGLKTSREHVMVDVLVKLLRLSR